jgi:hypothetical protein
MYWHIQNLWSIIYIYPGYEEYKEEIMTTSVGMKVGKKQSPVSDSSRQLEQSLLALESVCFNIMESRMARTRDDIDAMLWQRKFKSIVTPVSLAISEYRGPKHFHNHYRHKDGDESVLTPVIAEPLEMLVQACETSLKAAQKDLVGIPDTRIAKKARMLESALRSFLHRYEEIKSEG